MFWNCPVAEGGLASAPLNGRPPCTGVSLHTNFFMACAGVTHGPPLSLHPGEPAMAISSPNWSASVVVYLKASFHSGVIYTRRLSTTSGVLSAASKFWKPPMPTRFIHSRSSLMTSLVMLPFIQCHQTRGLALSGGFWKPRSSASPEFCAETIHAPNSTVRSAAPPARLARLKSCMYFYPFRFQCNPNHGARRNEFGTMPGAGKISGGDTRAIYRSQTTRRPHGGERTPGRYALRLPRRIYPDRDSPDES